MHKVYREKDCIEKFCEDLKVLTRKIINYEEREMILLTDEETKSYERQKFVTYAKQNFVQIKMKKKMNLNYTKESEIIVILQEILEELLILFAI